MNEKVLRFRPLRIVNGKCVVTSYMGWRKLAIANYDFPGYISPGKISIISVPNIPNQEVYNHEGELLYWNKADDFEFIGTRYAQSGGFYDCDGIPTFSHKSADQSVQLTEDDGGVGMKMYVDMKPLMSDQVIEAFNKLILNLKNIEWII